MLQVMAPKHFINKRIVGSRHENVLVFFRGKDKDTIPKLDVNLVYIPETAPEEGGEGGELKLEEEGRT